MIGLLARFMPKLPFWVFALMIVAALAASHGAVGIKAFEFGSRQEAGRWLARATEQHAQELKDREALAAARAARDEALRKLEQERADAVIQVRTEFLPAKQIVQRVVVEKPVYRDCRLADDGLRDAINAALRGRPGAVGPAIDGRQAVLPP